MIPLLPLVATLHTAGQQEPPRRCEAEPGRAAERITGEVRRGTPFESSTPGGWLVRLRPLEAGRTLEVTQKGREQDVARVEAFGRGWLRMDQYELSPTRRGERATMESLRFSICLTVPAKTTSAPRGR